MLVCNLLMPQLCWISAQHQDAQMLLPRSAQPSYEEGHNKWNWHANLSMYEPE